MHDPQDEVESGKEGLTSQEGLEPVAKEPSSEVAKVSRSHEHMLCQLQHSCCHCCISSVPFFCFLRKHLYMHDPQGEVESNKEAGKEGLKNQVGLEPVVKDPVGELAKVSCSHEHMLSQPQHSCCHCSFFCVACVYVLRKICMILRRRLSQARRT
jgi:hypothetical protein